MSNKQQAQKEPSLKVDKKRVPSEQASTENIPQVEFFGLYAEGGRLPLQPSSRSQCQASVLRLQRRFGNTYVQRLLAGNGKPPAIQKTVSVSGRAELSTPALSSVDDDERAGRQEQSSANETSQQEATQERPEETTSGAEVSSPGRQEQQPGAGQSADTQQQSPESTVGANSNRQAQQEQQSGAEQPGGGFGRQTDTRQQTAESTAGSNSRQDVQREESAGSGTGPGAGGAAGGAGSPTQSLNTSGPPEQVAQQLLGASASQIAISHSQAGEMLGQALTKEQEKTKQETRPLKAKLNGVAKQPEKPKAPEFKGKEAKIEEGEDLKEPPKPESKPHKEKSPPPKNEKMADDLPANVGEDPGMLAQMKGAVSGMMNLISTKDLGVKTKIADKPKFEATGKTDPNRAQSQAQEGVSQVQNQGQAAQENIEQMPGPETVQPQQVDEEKPVDVGKQAVQKPESTEQQELSEFAQMALPEEVRHGVDAKIAPMLAQTLSGPRQQVAEAAQRRDQEKQAAIEETEVEMANERTRADQEQMDAFTTSRQEIQQAKTEGKQQNQELMEQFDRETGEEKETVRGEVEQRIQEDSKQADDKIAKAEQDAAKEKQRGEQEAAIKKSQLKSESSSDSWWDQVQSTVRSVVRSVTQAIDGIFVRVRRTVRNIIDTAQTAVSSLIGAGRSWVTDKLDRFRNWVAERVNTIVGTIIPNLTRAIAERINQVVDAARNIINRVAGGFSNIVSSLANRLSNAIDAITSRFQSAINGVVGVFASLLSGDFAEALRIAFETAAEIAGVAKGRLMSILGRAGDAIQNIFRDPIGFLGNLINAVTTGFNRFKDNIVNHLRKGILGWLSSALEGAGIQLPETFNIKGIFSLVMQVLGITRDRIREKLTEMIGDRGTAVLERTWNLVSEMMAGGPGGLIDNAGEFIGDVKDQIVETIKTTVIDSLQNWAVVEIVQRAIARLVTMFNPAGAIIQAVSSIYNVIMFVQERMRQIASLGEAIFSSLASIVQGAVGGAASRIEQALARSIPMVLGFLARLVGLGGIAGRIREIIGNIRGRIDSVIDRILRGIVRFVSRAAGGFGEGDSETEGEVGTENAGGTINSG